MNQAVMEASNNGYFISKEGIVYGKKKQLKPIILYNGYWGFSYYFIPNGSNKKRVISIRYHRLQAYQKYGNLIFEKGMHVRHLNSIKTDNSYDNIAIGSALDNILDRPQDLRDKISLAASNSIRILSDQDVLSLYIDRKSGMTYSKLRVKYNLKTKESVQSIFKSKYLKRILNQSGIV